MDMYMCGSVNISLVMFKSLWKGIAWSLAATAVFVLIIALFIVLGMGGGATFVLIQIAKVLSIFFGVGKALGGTRGKGWLVGGIIGLVYTLFAFLAFSVVDMGEFSITTGILVEMLFAAVVGIASAFLLRGFAKN